MTHATTSFIAIQAGKKAAEHANNGKPFTLALAAFYRKATNQEPAKRKGGK